MFNFSIIPTSIEHIDEVCEDIVHQVKSGVATMPLFMMTLTPEGVPTIDKAELCCRAYETYKVRLDAMGIPSGALIQASIGHGWKLDAPSAFRKYEGLADGKAVEVCCPLDKGFQRYIRNSAARIAKAKPDHIMLDDDFRLLFRPGKGCACPEHMKRFNEAAGTKLTREELYDALCNRPAEAKELREVFIKTQIDSLIECAREIRGGIDEVAPTIPGSYCLCGISAEGAYEIASIMAGEGNPVIVRVNNANYCAKDHRKFSHVMYRAATQLGALNGKPDAILAETDTCPQNRYSTTATAMHSHFTFSILEGAKGAKHWITRLRAYEPASGKAYRAKLEKFNGFYNTLSELNDKLTFVGCNIPIPKSPYYVITPNDSEVDKNDWHSCILSLFGFPLYFSKEDGGVNFFAAKYDEKFTDEQMLKFLSGKVVLDGDSAKNLIKRGFGKYLGVSVEPYGASGPVVSGEITLDGKILGLQYGISKITPESECVKAHAHAYHLRDGVHKDILFPSVTEYKNELGGTAVVFAGAASFELGLVSAFGWLNETRKALFVKILSELGALPVYYPADAEVLLKAAKIEGGGMLVVFNDMSLDVLEEIPLVIKGSVNSISRLMPDGTFEEVKFTRDGENYTLAISACVLDPVVLIVK